MTGSRSNRIVSVVVLCLCLIAMAWLVVGLINLHGAIHQVSGRAGEHGLRLVNNFISRLPDTIPSYPRGVLPANSPAAVYIQELVDKGEIVRLTLLDANERSVYSVGRATTEVYAPFPKTPPVSNMGFLLEDKSGVGLIAPIIRHDLVAGTAGVVLPVSSDLAGIENSRKLYLSGIILDAVLLLVFGSMLLTSLFNKAVNPLFAPFQSLKDRLRRLSEIPTDRMNTAALGESVKKITETFQQMESEPWVADQSQQIPIPPVVIAEEQPTCPQESHLESETADGESRKGEPQQVSKVLVSALIEEAHAELSRQRDLSDLEFISSSPQDLPSTAIAPDKLKQVLVNLMLNARDVMPGGGPLVVRAKADRFQSADNCWVPAVRIDVLDSGKGLSAKQQVRIFDPTYRPKTIAKDVVSRLVQAKGVVEESGGKIEVKSKVGKGSCFTVWLTTVFCRCRTGS